MCIRDSPNINPPGQLPVLKEKETIRVVISQSPHVLSYAYGENKFTTWLEDRTNVAVEFILYPEADATTKLNIELSTKGDLGDMINILMDRAMLVTYGGQGVLAPLNDLIEQYGFGMKECLDAFPGSYEAITAPDGNIYALPQGSLVGIFPNSFAERFWIQNNFLAKYTTATGKKMPTTTDELYEYMKWAVNNDANGNGKKDEVGWTGAEKTSVWYARPTCFLMNAFTLNNQDGYYQKDDVIHCAMVEEGYRTGLKYLAKLMDEGLMDPNYPDNDENAIKTLVALEGGNTVATISCGGMHNAATDHKIRNMYTIVAPLKGPTGLQNSFYDHYAAGVLPGKATIPMASDKKDIVMAWMDTMYDQEVYNRSHYGEPGVDWEIPPAGTLAADGGPATYRKIPNMSSVPIYSHWYTSGPAMWNRNGNYTVPKVPDTAANGNPIHDLEGTLYNASRLYEDYVIPCSVPTFFFDLETAAKVDGWKSAIDTYCRTAITDYIFGRRAISDDADWAAYVAGARALGLDDYLKVMQDNYNANWKGTLPNVYEKKPFRTA
jgi:putative aldouronate transport system substrate-binding protein